MKKIILIILFSISLLNITLAWKWDQSAKSIIDDLKEPDVQKTKLDNINWKWIKWTLKSIRENSSSYLQWLAYIWLWIALLLITYNWIMLVVSWLNWSDQVWKFKKRFTSLVIWVVIVTSWFYVIKLIVSLLWEILW